MYTRGPNVPRERIHSLSSPSRLPRLKILAKTMKEIRRIPRIMGRQRLCFFGGAEDEGVSLRAESLIGSSICANFTQSEISGCIYPLKLFPACLLVHPMTGFKRRPPRFHRMVRRLMLPRRKSRSQQCSRNNAGL